VLKRLRERYKTKRWFRWSVDLLVLLVVVGGVGLYQTRNLVHGAAPQFALPGLDGREFTLQSYSGKPVLLAFWAPWCQVCRENSDNVSRVMRWMDGRANVVSIATRYNNDNEVKAYVAEHEVPYRVLLDHGQIADEYSVQSFPTFYFLDAQGNVKHTAVGYTSTLGMLWRLLL
jgi:peroxiredoxin